MAVCVHVVKATAVKEEHALQPPNVPIVSSLHVPIAPPTPLPTPTQPGHIQRGKPARQSWETSRLSKVSQGRCMSPGFSLRGVLTPPSPPSPPSPSLAYPDHLVNLRLTSKQMVRGSKKCESSEKEAKTKLKKAIEARNTEGARIYAQVRDPPLALLLHPRISRNHPTVFLHSSSRFCFFFSNPALDRTPFAKRRRR